MSAPDSRDFSHLLDTPLMRRAMISPIPSDTVLDAMCKGSANSASSTFSKFRSFTLGAYGSLRRMRTEGQRASAHATRRKRGGDGRLPHDMRCEYTEGQRAVLSVIGEQVAKSGTCSFPMERLAAVAGVGVRTVQYAIRRAQTLGHLAVTYRPRRGKPSLTNIVRVVAKKWLSWLRPKAQEAKNIGCKKVHTMENKNSNRGNYQQLNQSKDRKGLRKGSDGKDCAPNDKPETVERGQSWYERSLT